MNQYADGRAFLNNEDDTDESISSNEPLPADEVSPHQLGDTPRPFLRSLGLKPPRPPVATVASPKPSAGRGPEKTGSGGRSQVSGKCAEVSVATKKRKAAAPYPKKWVPLCFRERKRDAYFYSIDGKGFHVE